jgi:signal transduction histidine kinase
MGNIFMLLFYIAVVVRSTAWHYVGKVDEPLVFILLAAYGALLVTEPFLSRRLRWYPGVYLVLQTGLVIATLRANDDMDFLPTLFYPLSFVAVQFFGRRVGFIWIAGFILAMAGPVLIGWEWQLAGVMIVVLDGACCVLVGSYAHLIQHAEQAREANQGLLTELQGTHRQLQEYSAQVEELAIVQERSHMARELHDSVTQTVFSMNLTVQAARMLVGKEASGVAQQLDRLQELARGATGEIQMLVSQLRPHSVTEEGLPAALHRLAVERQKRDGLEINLEINGEKQFPETILLGLFRIAQEALNNVAKHAGTPEAVIRLNLEDNPAYLEVEDHGCGFDTGKTVSGLSHFGLAGIADRARELGWELKIDSLPGRGTRIRVEEKLA